MNGWQWLSATRKVNYINMNTVGLRSGPERYTIPIKGTNGIKTLTVKPPIFKQVTNMFPILKPNILSPIQRTKEQSEEAEKEMKIATGGKIKYV